TLKMPAFEWVHVQLHQQKGMISLSPPTICNSADKFIREVAQRVPQQKESLMTIAEVLQQEAKQQEALRIAQMMLANGISHEIILKITGLSAKDLLARQAAPH
ncbi:MAG: hypothetical protein E6989_14380, partial [Citrobacter freundii]|nr:hypothetical protein [Citrobacter freundii]MDU1222435.1 hypothetical protein [Citrobacter freundii]